MADEITRRELLVGAAAAAATAALPVTVAEVAPAAATLVTDYGFIVSTLASCGRHGNLGDRGPSIVGYQQDHECFAGVWMDADNYYEGYLGDTIYKPCPCNPKHCKDCAGHGWVNMRHGDHPEYTAEDGDPDDTVDIECAACDGSGWVGEPEHPDDRYCGWLARKDDEETETADALSKTEAR